MEATGGHLRGSKGEVQAVCQRYPDIGRLQAYSPTTQSETIMVFRLLIQPMGMKMFVADSQKLQRPQGRMFVEPCAGLPVKGDRLIELVARVYGLNHAPFLWHRMVADHLLSIGCRRCLMDCCLYVRRPKDKISDIILIEVDVVAIGSKGSTEPRMSSSRDLISGSGTK